MPAFGEEETLTEKQIGLLADWIRGDWVRTEEDQQLARAE
jgi:mono/diheme cytochrome c family protein